MQQIMWSNLSQEQLQFGVDEKQLSSLRFANEKACSLEKFRQFIHATQNNMPNALYAERAVQMLLGNPALPKKLERLVLKTIADSFEKQETALPTAIPQGLLQDQRKNWFYAQDPFFRTGLDSFQSCLKDLQAFAHKHTYLIIKPDGLVSRSFDRVVKYLQDHGFEILGYDSFQYQRNSCRLFWYYEANLFPVPWFKLFEMVLGEKKSVVFLLKDLRPGKEGACKRLYHLKGSTIDQKRDEEQLRRSIGAGSGLFCYIHTPDDSLSMMREWAIILDEKQRKHLLKRAESREPVQEEELRRFKEMIYENLPAHDLNYENTKQRLRNFSERLEPSLRNQLLEFVDHEEIPWKKFLNFVKKNNLKISEWDLIVFCGNRSEPIQKIKPIIQ